MDADVLLKLLGLRDTDLRVEDALRAYGVLRRPKLVVDAADADGPVVSSQDWVSNLSVGIEFGFQEEGATMGLDQLEWGAGPMLLSEIYFYGERAGTRAYPQPLPFGLSLRDNRAAVRAKMARLESTRRSYVRDTWDLPDFRITVSYADGGTRIDFVVCMLRIEAPEPFEGGMAAMPRVDDMIALLGKRIDEVGVRRVFVPLGLDRPALDSSNDQLIDLRRTYGLKLHVRPLGSGRESTQARRRLHGIECMRAGELESRGWRGDLPFGIRFDDSPEAALAKVGQPPLRQEDQDFSGQAFWELPEYSLQVIYSTMENIVLRVCVFEAGA